MTSKAIPSDLHEFRGRRSQREERAVEVGPVELMALLEWELRYQPRALRNIRTKFKRFCVELFQRLEKARCGQ